VGESGGLSELVFTTPETLDLTRRTPEVEVEGGDGDEGRRSFNGESWEDDDGLVCSDTLPRRILGEVAKDGSEGVAVRERWREMTWAERVALGFASATERAA